MPHIGPPSYGLIDLLQEPCRFVLASLLDCLLVLILQGTLLFSWGFRRGAIRISPSSAPEPSSYGNFRTVRQCHRRFGKETFRGAD